MVFPILPQFLNIIICLKLIKQNQIRTRNLNFSSIINFGVQRFRYCQGIISHYEEKMCQDNCNYQQNIAMGDQYKVTGVDLAAEQARKRQN